MAEISRKIYTRFGDRGQTKLLSGETAAKDDLRVDTYGTLDELQSHLGMARSLVQDETVRSILYAIQKDLFIAGAELASTPQKLSRLENRLDVKNISKLEHWIDQMTDQYGHARRFCDSRGFSGKCGTPCGPLRLPPCRASDGSSEPYHRNIQRRDRLHQSVE